MSKLAGKVAVVTGASKGIGASIAEHFGAAGASVVVNYSSSKAGADAVVKKIIAKGGKAIAVQGDVSKQEDIVRLFAETKKAYGKLDILVNNAGGPPPGDFRDFTEEMWLAALNANMLSPIAMIRAVIDPMIARRFGRIVNITSAAVKSPIGTLGLSNGARAGLTGFVAGLARDVAKHNVTINNLLPGPFNTERLQVTAGNSAP